MICAVCNVGSLEDKVVSTWIQRGDKWSLALKVRALVCDNCGDASFSQETAERLARLRDETTYEVPTGFYNAWVFDLEQMDEDKATGKRPAITSTDLAPPGYPRPTTTVIPVQPTISTGVKNLLGSRE